MISSTRISYLAHNSIIEVDVVSNKDYTCRKRIIIKDNSPIIKKYTSCPLCKTNSFLWWLGWI